jgi:hypothetical protein
LSVFLRLFFSLRTTLISLMGLTLFLPIIRGIETRTFKDYGYRHEDKVRLSLTSGAGTRGIAAKAPLHLKLKGTFSASILIDRHNASLTSTSIN